MWFPWAIVCFILISQTKAEMLKSFPPTENRNGIEDYPFYLRFFDNQFTKETDVKKSPFIALKEIRSHSLYTCGCDIQPHTIDLGNDYVPRVILTGTCKAERCISGFCRSVDYKLPVLRRKKNEEDVSSASLPLELSDDFVREIKTITVGCQCKP